MSGPEIGLCIVKLHAPTREELLHDAPAANDRADVRAEELEVVDIGSRNGLGGENALISIPDPVKDGH